MKLVFITFGSEGDNRPLIALASGFIHHGHDVVLLGEKSAAPTAKKAGVPFLALAGDIKATTSPGGALHTMMNKNVSVRDMAKACAEVANHATSSWMRSLLEVSEGVDGIIFSGFASYVALSVAEYLKIPAIAAGLYPLTPTRDFPSSLLPPWKLPGWLNLASHKLMMWLMWRLFSASLNAARKELCGQPASKRPWKDYPVVYGISPHLIARPNDWPENCVLTGAWYTFDADWQPDGSLAAFLKAGEPPIYVGFGSMSGFDQRQLVEALVVGLEGRRALFFPGWSDIDVSLLPANFYILGETPHDWLLPQVSLAIHHGGAGTTHSVIKAGVPSVVLPFAGDQFFWAERLRMAGVAPEYVTSNKIKGNTLNKLVLQAESADMITRAKMLAGWVAEEEGVTTAIHYIERYIGEM